MRNVVDNLNQRGTAFSLVLNDNGADLFKNSANVFRKFATSEKDYIFIAVIYHDKDFINEEQRFKTPHYHVVITFTGSYRVGTIINWVVDLFGCNSNQVSCEKCNSVPMQVRYMIHLDDFDKYQYDGADVISNRNDLVEKYFKQIRKIIDTDDLIAIVREYKSLPTLMSVIGLENYKKYRIAIMDLRREFYNV